MFQNSIKVFHQYDENAIIDKIPELHIKHSVSLSTNDDFSSENNPSSRHLLDQCFSALFLGEIDNVQEEGDKTNYLQTCPNQSIYSQIKNYQLQEIIGRGNFGVVYRGIFLPTCQQVALKVIDFSEFEDSYRENVIQFYENQIAILKKLQEKSKFRFSCKFYGAFVDEDHGYIVMELLEGFSLQQLIQSKFYLKPQEERFYLACILLALQELHESIGCMHRDIKPQNIMILPNGELLLLDFGCAKLINKKQRTTSITGTCQYFSPSRFRCNYGVQADIWSFGVSAYELVTRQLPFRYKYMQDSPQQQKFNKLSSLLIKKKQIKLEQLSNHNPLVQQLIQKIFNQIMNNEKYDGIEQIKESQYFKQIDWVKLCNNKMKPPRTFSFQQISQIRDLTPVFHGF